MTGYKFSLTDILLVYLFFGSKLLISIYSLTKQLIRSHRVQKNDGINFKETNSTNSPFSIFNYIIYHPALFTEDELHQIIAHDKIHVQQKHSIDVLISEIIGVIFWFNPFTWLYK